MTGKFELAKKIDVYFDKKERTSKERDYFYVSELGKSKKAIYESMKNLKKEKYDPRVKRIFDNGDYMHARYFKYFAEMGILIAAEVVAVENDLFHGRLDAIITDGEQNYILDLKSCSNWTFRKLTDATPEHKLQLQFYLYYRKIQKGMVLYENKDTQEIKIFEIELDIPLVEKTIEEFRKFKEDIINGIVPSEEIVKMEDIQYGV